MRDANPYDVLQVRPGASDEEVEDAYNALFGEYESKALAGDRKAAELLHRLNEALDALMDPDQRAAIDTAMKMEAPAPQSANGQETREHEPAPSGAKGGRSKAAAQQHGRMAAPSQPFEREATVKVRRRAKERPRSVPRRASRPLVPYALVAALALALVAGLLYILARPGQTPVEPSRGAVVATVNGAPIYQQDWDERVAFDKNTALSDPLFAPFFNNFQGVTGTRALDVLKYDALDKLINLQVIQQEAKKEGVYPNDAQQRDLINKAKSEEVKPDETFESFLQRYGITEGQYNRRIISNVVYSVMAERRMPPTGSDQDRIDGFIRWFCEARQSYDVTLLVTFIVENQPCSSGLPADVPLPGLTGEVPEPEQTAPVPVPEVSPAPTQTGAPGSAPEAEPTSPTRLPSDGTPPPSGPSPDSP